MKTERPRARRNERGACLVEAIFVIAALVLFMVLSLRLHGKYVEGSRALDEARTAAWSSALEGCGHSTEYTSVVQRAFHGSIPRAPEQFVIRTPLRTVDAKVEHDAPRPSTPPRRIAVACNEVPFRDDATLSALADSMFGPLIAHSR